MTDSASAEAIARLHSAARDRLIWIVGSDQLIRLGLEALLAGVDTPSLRLLAGLTRREESEASDLFDAVIDELGLSALLPPDAEAALWQIALDTARDIVSGDVAPIEGADLIYETPAKLLDYPTALRPFIQAVVEAYDPGCRKSLEQIAADVVAAARQLLAERSPAGG